jgi:hypothetical protein
MNMLSPEPNTSDSQTNGRKRRLARLAHPKAARSIATASSTEPVVE